MSGKTPTLVRDRIVGLERIDASLLDPHPDNWRLHGDEQRSALSNVLAKVGWADAIVARKVGDRYQIIDGHLRQETGGTMPVLVVDLDDDEARFVLATHDRLAAMADIDEDALRDLVDSFEVDMADFGWPEDELKAIAEDGEIGQDDAPDKSAELQREWGPETGQLWLIGTHRLMIGDATKQNDVAKLLHGSVPYLMVTDPPYGVDYDPNWRNEAAEAGSIGYAASRVGEVANDSQRDWSAAYALFPGAVAYVWHAGRYASTISDNLEDLSFEIRCQLIWSKSRFAISRGHYHWQHEPCWYAVKKGQTANWCGDRSQTTLWEIKPTTEDAENLSHSTMKPVECMARPIRNHTGDVYDPFIGSGTTMVAAQQLDRRCWGMEIDPGYAAVTLERMSRLGVDCERIDNR